MPLKHDYFIIESLDPNDIKDGEIFRKGLESLKIEDPVDKTKRINLYNPIYKAVDTPEEFDDALTGFEASNYGYLFISSHGDDLALDLNGGSYDTHDLEDSTVKFQNRRIFMSTCRGGTELFARHFIRKGAYSVIGAPDDLAQIVATGMWVTMAWIFERFSDNRLGYEQLDFALDHLAKVYQIDLAYYSFIREKQQMKEYIYFPEKDKKRSRNDLPL